MEHIEHLGSLHAYASGSGSLSFVIRDENRNPVSGRRPQAEECIAFIKAKQEAGEGAWKGSEYVIVNQGPLDREGHEHYEAVRKVERVAPNALKMNGHVYEYDPAQVTEHTIPKFNFELAGRTQEIEGTGNNGALGYFLRNEKVLSDPARIVWDSTLELDAAISLKDGAQVVDGGRHMGKVVDIADGYAVQNTGRGTLKLHDLKQLNQPVNIGDEIDVNYVGKSGLVTIIEPSKGVER